MTKVYLIYDTDPIYLYSRLDKIFLSGLDAGRYVRENTLRWFIIKEMEAE